MTEYDKLIAALRFCDGGECDGCCEYKKEHGCNTLLRDAADAIEKLASAQEKWINIERNALIKSIPKWIPVTERLPKAVEEDVNGNKVFSDFVLVFCVYQDGFIWIGADKCRVDERTWLIEIPSDHCKVTHWMPLPEPPERSITHDGA